MYMSNSLEDELYIYFILPMFEPVRPRTGWNMHKGPFDGLHGSGRRSGETDTL